MHSAALIPHAQIGAGSWTLLNVYAFDMLLTVATDERTSLPKGELYPESPKGHGITPAPTAPHTGESAVHEAGMIRTPMTEVMFQDPGT